MSDADVNLNTEMLFTFLGQLRCVLRDLRINQRLIHAKQGYAWGLVSATLLLTGFFFFLMFQEAN